MKKRKYTKKKPIIESEESKKERKKLFIKEKLEKRDRLLKEASEQVVKVPVAPKVMTLKDIFTQFIIDLKEVYDCLNQAILRALTPLTPMLKYIVP